MILLGLLTAAVVMFATGLGMRASDFRQLGEMQGPGLYGLGLQLFGLPLAAMLIGGWLDIAPYHGMGLMLVALAPATTASQVLVGLAGGHIGLARMLTGWSTLAWLPIMLGLGMLAAIPVTLVVALLGMVLPLLAGVLIGRKDRARAARLEPVAALIGSGLTGILLLLNLLRDWPLLDARIVLTVLLLVAVAMGAGLLARLFFGRGIGLTLAIALPMQNIALPLAVGTFGAFGLPVALYGVAMYLAAFAALLLSRRA